MNWWVRFWVCLWLWGSPAWGLDCRDCLDHVLLQVNDQRVQLKNHETIAVVRGDVLEVISAQGSMPITAVNFVGFPNGNGKNPIDDRGFKVRTQKDLLKRFALDSGDEMQVYAIEVKSEENLLGSVFVKILPPKLRYAVIRTDSGKKVVRDGEVISLLPNEEFKVEQIVMNLDTEGSDVTYKLFPLSTREEGKDQESKLFELRFFRYDQDFGKIILHMKQ